jgi:hypothetical protein
VQEQVVSTATYSARRCDRIGVDNTIILPFAAAAAAVIDDDEEEPELHLAEEPIGAPAAGNVYRTPTHYGDCMSMSTSSPSWMQTRGLTVEVDSPSSSSCANSHAPFLSTADTVTGTTTTASYDRV